ncbi:class I SAM-dependent methyltransferase [Colwellia sp. MEBiC06753]
MLNLIDQINLDDLSQSQRLFHGRGHAFEGLEHVCIDWFEPILLITLYKEESDDWLLAIGQQFSQLIPACKSVHVQHRWRKLAPVERILGDDCQSTYALESGLRYHIELGKAQNHGLFLDMKNGRDWVQSNAEGKRVLNLFSYTCGFSVAAIAGGAKQVINVDMSKSALAKGRENHRLNNQDTNKVVFQGVDIFKSFGRLKKLGPYQLIIIDPPSFQKGSVNIVKDYGKILRRIPDMATEGADVMLCLNSPDLDEQFLLDTASSSCPALKFKQAITPPTVFKEAHQGKGLKVLVFKFDPYIRN